MLAFIRCFNMQHKKPKKLMIIAEVGLNHLGDKNYANQYVDKIINSKPDGITFQVREKNFYSNPTFSNLLLPNEYYTDIIKKIKKNNIKFGIALSDENFLAFFEELNVDFYKVLSKDITNLPFISKLIDTKKRIFISTGMSNIHEISRLVEFAKANNRLTLIHTQLTHNINDINLKAIPMLRKKFGLPVAFGNHSTNVNVLYLALAFEPSDLFFYLKGNRAESHPDEEHAIPLNELNQVLNNLRELTKSIGEPVKLEMDNIIEKGYDKKT